LHIVSTQKRRNHPAYRVLRSLAALGLQKETTDVIVCKTFRAR
jgi:hypothetical protein